MKAEKALSVRRHLETAKRALERAARALDGDEIGGLAPVRTNVVAAKNAATVALSDLTLAEKMVSP